MGVIEPVQDTSLRETDTAQAIIRGGEVHRIRRERPLPEEKATGGMDPRTIVIACFLLCAFLAAAIGVGAWIELSPQMWSVVAFALSAVAGLLALFPHLDLHAVVERTARLTGLAVVLAIAVASGYWVSSAPLTTEGVILVLCAPPLLAAAVWRRHWSVMITAALLVAAGTMPSVLENGAIPPSHLAAAALLTALLLGALYGSSGTAVEPARPAPAVDGPTMARRPAAAILELARSFASLEQGDVAQVIVNESARTLGACGAILLLWDESVEAYRVGALTGAAPADLSEIRQVELMPEWLARLSKGNRMVTPIALAAVREPVLLSLIRRWNARSLYAVPFYRGTNVLGALLIGRSKARTAFSEADDEILSGMAPHAAAALAHSALIADLKSANALKEEFMATMSHELRTPLNVIIGYTDMQIEGAFGDLDEEHNSVLQTVREQAVQLLELIQATLDMSRLERGLVSLDPTEVDVRQMLVDLQKKIPPSWRKPTVTLEWKIDDNLPQLITDGSKLQILLRNLIHNAMKFTNNGLVLVSAMRHPSKPSVTFLVQDSGVGIKAEHLSQIFDMFRQAPGGESQAGGVGLGLYIVKRLAAALGAEIEVSSAPGRGASFRIHVPLPETPPTAS